MPRTCKTCGIERPKRTDWSTISDDLAKRLKRFDRLIKISVVQKLLTPYFVKVPSRPTIASWIKIGELKGLQMGKNRSWYVRHSSLDRLIKKIARPLSPNA